VALAGPGPAFALDAATFAVSAVTLFGIRVTQPAGAAGPAGCAEPADAADAAVSPAPAVTPGAVVIPGPDAVPVPEAQARADRETVWALLRSSRVLQVILLVTVAANLGTGGAFEVALPALAHGPLHAGARGYGALTAAFAIGALLGTLLAGQLGGVRRPALLGSAVFLVTALLEGLVPYAGGTAAVAAVLAGVGIMNGTGNIVMLTVFQRWAPPALLGRLTALIMLASFGLFPLSALLAAVVVHSAGPAPFFLIGGGTLAAAILAGLSQRSWRDLGAASPDLTIGDSSPGSRLSGYFESL
jgi:MFS family permease